MTAVARARASSDSTQPSEPASVTASEGVIVEMSKYTDQEQSWGAMPVVIVAGDELQFPCVPQAAGLLAPIIGTSDEQTTAVKLFSGFREVYRLTTAKRFEDPMLVNILRNMRQKGGCKLSRTEWHALQNTEVPEICVLKNTEGWFESAYEWSIVTLATVARCQLSAHHHGTPLFIVQAQDGIRQRCECRALAPTDATQHIEKARH